MKNIFPIIVFFLTISLFIQNCKGDEIKVMKHDINTINIALDYDYFTVIELENEVINVISLNTRSLNVQKLNNKSVLIFAYESNLPLSLGKVIINDSACNSYAINLFKGKQNKDQVISIANSNRQRVCTPPNKKGFDGFAAMGNTRILYSENKNK